MSREIIQNPIYFSGKKTFQSTLIINKSRFVLHTAQRQVLYFDPGDKLRCLTFNAKGAISICTRFVWNFSCIPNFAPHSYLTHNLAHLHDLLCHLHISPKPSWHIAKIFFQCDLHSLASETHPPPHSLPPSRGCYLRKPHGWSTKFNRSAISLCALFFRRVLHKLSPDFPCSRPTADTQTLWK